MYENLFLLHTCRYNEYSYAEVGLRHSTQQPHSAALNHPVPLVPQVNGHDDDDDDDGLYYT